MDAIADLKEVLRGDGKRLGGGGFTIDPLRAREKLERFRLDDPRRYVVSLVQAAVAAGATAIDFELGAKDVTMRAAGLSIDVAALDDLETALYSTPRDALGRAHRHLALAIAAARALSPREIELRSGRAAVLLPAQGVPIVSTVSSASAIDGLEVHVRERFGKLAAIRFCRDLFGELAEERFLRQVGDPVMHVQVERDRGDALLRAVHDELIWLRANHSHHVEALSLDCIALAPNEAGRAVVVDADGIRIDPRHPLIAGCLANIDGPTPGCYPASVVFSAINERWDEITDDHERAFHEALVQRLMVMIAST